MQGLTKTFCSKCYTGIVSHGDGSGELSTERKECYGFESVFSFLNAMGTGALVLSGFSTQHGSSCYEQEILEVQRRATVKR